MRFGLNIYSTQADKNEFDQEMRKVCGKGRLDALSLPRPDAENYLSMLIRMVQTGSTEVGAYQRAKGVDPPGILVDLIDDSSMNACVVPRQSGGYWIGIYSGLYLTLFTIYNQIFRHKHLFTDIGDPSAEEHEGPILIDDTGAYSSARFAYEQIDWEPSIPDEILRLPLPDNSKLISMGKPRDSVRFEAYITCLAAAWDTVICHELAHILNGHFKIMSDSDSVKAFFEALAHDPHSKDNVLRHAMESEADDSAAVAAWTRWRHAGDILSYKSRKTQTSDPILQLRLWFITVNALYWAFTGTTSTQLSRYDEWTHPHPDVRYSATAALLHTVFGQALTSEKQQLLFEGWPKIRADTLDLRTALHATRDSHVDVETRRFDDPSYRREIQIRLQAIEQAKAELRSQGYDRRIF